MTTDFSKIISRYKDNNLMFSRYRGKEAKVVKVDREDIKCRK